MILHRGRKRSLAVVTAPIPLIRRNPKRTHQTLWHRLSILRAPGRKPSRVPANSFRTRRSDGTAPVPIPAARRLGHRRRSRLRHRAATAPVAVPGRAPSGPAAAPSPRPPPPPSPCRHRTRRRCRPRAAAVPAPAPRPAPIPAAPRLVARRADPYFSRRFLSSSMTT